MSFSIIKYPTVFGGVNVVDSSVSMDMGDTGYYTFTGTTATWTLKAISGNTGTRYVIINDGSGTLTLDSNAGENDIWDAGSSVNTFNINPGETALVYNNSLKYAIL